MAKVRGKDRLVKKRKPGRLNNKGLWKEILAPGGGGRVWYANDLISPLPRRKGQSGPEA